MRPRRSPAGERGPSSPTARRKAARNLACTPWWNTPARISAKHRARSSRGAAGQKIAPPARSCPSTTSALCRRRDLPTRRAILPVDDLIQNRPANLVATCQEIFQPGSCQDRSIRPTIRRHISDVGVIEGFPVLLIESEAWIKRSYQGLNRREAREEIGILCRDEDLLFLNRLQKLLLLTHGSSGEKLLKHPIPIGAVAESGILLNHPHGLVQNTALHLSHLRLIVGIAYVQVLVRDHQHGPLPGRVQGFPEMARAPAKSHGQFRRGCRRKFGHSKFHPLLAKITIGQERLHEFLMADRQQNLPRVGGRIVTYKYIHDLCKLVALILI